MTKKFLPVKKSNIQNVIYINNFIKNNLSKIKQLSPSLEESFSLNKNGVLVNYSPPKISKKNFKKYKYKNLHGYRVFEIQFFRFKKKQKLYINQLNKIITNNNIKNDNNNSSKKNNITYLINNKDKTINQIKLNIKNKKINNSHNYEGNNLNTTKTKIFKNELKINKLKNNNNKNIEQVMKIIEKSQLKTNSNNKPKRIQVYKYFSKSEAGQYNNLQNKVNQDNFLITEHINQSDDEAINDFTFGIFDGHEKDGGLVSFHIKKFFSKCTNSQLNNRDNLINTFVELNRYILNTSSFNNFDLLLSGSTCIIVHITNNKIICANIGDSRAILITKDDMIIPLSIDHKPNLPEEKRRIEEANGEVVQLGANEPFRVCMKKYPIPYPGLAMSRSIGDKIAHRLGVSDKPEIKEFDINEYNPKAVIIGSDGLWDFTTNENVKSIVDKCIREKNYDDCAKNLIEISRKKWVEYGNYIDDITCIVVFFKQL